MTTVLSKASEKIGAYVWSNGNASGSGNLAAQGQASQAPAVRKYSFGDRNPVAQEELDRFLASEDYLETLRESFNSLALELLSLIDCTEESSKNY